MTETKHAAPVEAARTHHQNPVALVEALKKADVTLARITDIAKADHKLVTTVLVADDLGWIAALDIARLNGPNEVPVADALILVPTHGTMAQVIGDRVLASTGVITDQSLVHTEDTSVMVDPTSDIMPVDMAVITPSSTYDMVRCTTVDSAHTAVITAQSLVHTAGISAMAGLTPDIMPADMAVITQSSSHDMVRCTAVDSAHTGVITVRSLVHTTATSVMAGLTSDTTPVDMVVTTPGSTHDMVRCTTVDSAHTGVITAQSLVHTTATSVTVDLTLDIMPKATLIISTLILVHDTVARCPDIISVHETATAHISAHAV